MATDDPVTPNVSAVEEEELTAIFLAVDVSRVQGEGAANDPLSCRSLRDRRGGDSDYSGSCRGFGSREAGSKKTI